MFLHTFPSTDDFVARIRVRRMKRPGAHITIEPILGDDYAFPADAGTFGETRYVSDTRRILELLAERHGFPKVH